MINVTTVDGAHEILMRQLPKWFKPVLEYIEIMEAYAVEMAGMESDAGVINQNYFIQTADADTLSMWEGWLGIARQVGETLEFRRERILTRLSQTVPFTYWHFKERLTELFGDEYDLVIGPENCTMSILVTSQRYGAVELLNDLILSVVPAHIAVTANQLVQSSSVSNQFIGSAVTLSIERTIGIAYDSSEQEIDASLGAAVLSSQAIIITIGD